LRVALEATLVSRKRLGMRVVAPNTNSERIVFSEGHGSCDPAFFSSLMP
jgi:hypothetical protein